MIEPLPQSRNRKAPKERQDTASGHCKTGLPVCSGASGTGSLLFRHAKERKNTTTNYITFNLSVTSLKYFTLRGSVNALTTTATHVNMDWSSLYFVDHSIKRTWSTWKDANAMKKQNVCSQTLYLSTLLKTIRQFGNLVGHCLITNCYFQHCNIPYLIIFCILTTDLLVNTLTL